MFIVWEAISFQTSNCTFYSTQHGIFFFDHAQQCVLHIQVGTHKNRQYIRSRWRILNKYYRTVRFAPTWGTSNHNATDFLAVVDIEVNHTIHLVQDLCKSSFAGMWFPLSHIDWGTISDKVLVYAYDTTVRKIIEDQVKEILSILKQFITKI